ncbi:MAG: DMT family transporter [Paracoccaceae bacterium]
MKMTDVNGLRRIAAPLFVLLWSTGFIGAEYGLPHAEPMTFLTLRFAMAALALGLWAALAGEFRTEGAPGRVDYSGAVVVGALMHAIYLGGVFTAIWLGAGAGLTALIVGLQPVATALISGAMLNEALTARQWLGMALGLGGVALVVGWKLFDGGIGFVGVGFCLIGLISISFASILQKRRAVRTRLAADSAVQFAAAALITGLASAFFEDQRVDWSVEFIAALGWMVVGLSLGAVSLYYVLLRRGAAAETASLFFLVPGVTAAMAAMMFGEQFGLTEIIGLSAAMLGVWLVNAATQAPAASASR